MTTPEIATLADALEYLDQHQDPPVSVDHVSGSTWRIIIGVDYPQVSYVDDAGLLGAARELAGLRSWEEGCKEEEQHG